MLQNRFHLPELVVTPYITQFMGIGHFPGMRVYCVGCTDKPIRFSGAYKRSPPHWLRSRSPPPPGRRSPPVPKLGPRPESESGFYPQLGWMYPDRLTLLRLRGKPAGVLLCGQSARTSSLPWVPEPSFPSFRRSARVLGRWSWLRHSPLVARGPNAPWKQLKTGVEKVKMCCRNSKINSWECNYSNLTSGKKSQRIPIPERRLSAGGCSSVVERALRMCEVPGSIPGISKQPRRFSFSLLLKNTIFYITCVYTCCSHTLGSPKII